jgi:hypothetical protein
MQAEEQPALTRRPLLSPMLSLARTFSFTLSGP